MALQKTLVVLLAMTLVLRPRCSFSWGELAQSSVDCTTVTQLLSTCSVFITYGSPDPLPGSPCCDAVVGVENLGSSIENRRAVCQCLMGLIAAYNPSSTALATLPGFCGVSLGFTIDPNIDCNYIPYLWSPGRSETDVDGETLEGFVNKRSASSLVLGSRVLNVTHVLLLIVC